MADAAINDGSPRTITYVQNLDDQILASDNTKGPQARTYFFNGVQMAEVSNDGTGNVTYSQSITQQTTKPGTGFYGVDDSTSPINTASFGTQFENINGFGNQNPLVSSYTVQAGDTLVSIAQAIWGDGNFWYLLAQANGLSSDATLSAGQVLNIPQNVVANQNTASTNTVYNPDQALGNTAPTHSAPPPRHHHGCGVIGEIILAVVAIAVAVVTAGAAIAGLAAAGTEASSGIAGALAAVADGSAAGALAGGGLAGFATLTAIGAGAGALGSIVSQGIGLATGLQSKFSWSQVGLAAIGGAVGTAMPSTGLFQALGIAPTAAQVAAGITATPLEFAAQGVIDSAVGQGLDMAAGLQKQFSWAEVAAAGVGAYAGAYVGGQLAGAGNWAGSASTTQLADRFVSGVAGDIANAATMSLITGSDFGDNLIRALPDTIGQTIGNAIAGQIDESSNWPVPGTDDTRLS